MSKFKDQKQLSKIVSELKVIGKKVVFTNGCFDIIHAGHIHYLREAKSLGDVLIVAINSDSSIKRLKPGRPIVPQGERIEVISALQMVDYVTVFDEDTPYNLIKLLRPDILVKGGDWKRENIVGADLVEEVYSLSYYEGISTTKIIETILERFCNKE
jgi:D-beta-D-heptose 7-phosphate kinase/D-beta-D-heptose 1-phosphate adenosyltransferase